MRTLLRSVAIGLLVALTGIAASAQSKESLRGLVGFEVSIDDVSDQSANSQGLTPAQLQTDVELRLRKAGIQVLSKSQRQALPSQPVLYIALTLIPDDPNVSRYAFHIECAVVQRLLVGSSNQKLMVYTWIKGVTGLTNKAQLAGLRSDVGDLVDDFINAYLSVNPKK